MGAIAAAVLTVGTATALAAVQTGTYKGVTSQIVAGKHLTVGMILVPGKVKYLKTQFRATCQSGKTYTNGLITRNMALQSRHFARGGAFSFAGPGGFRGAVVYGLAGLVRTNGTALGALDLTVTFTNSSGAFVDKCSKSGISWHARKQ